MLKLKYCLQLMAQDNCFDPVTDWY